MQQEVQRGMNEDPRAQTTAIRSQLFPFSFFHAKVAFGGTNGEERGGEKKKIKKKKSHGEMRSAGSGEGGGQRGTISPDS